MVSTLISSFFTVVGGAMPIAILIYLFSRKEKKRLLAYADQMESALPLQEQLLERIAKLVNESIKPNNVANSLDNLQKYNELRGMLEKNKKFIKYARNYNFISAVGHVLRMGNYMPRSISEHREISKNLPSSLSPDT